MAKYFITNHEIGRERDGERYWYEQSLEEKGITAHGEIMMSIDNNLVGGVGP